MIAGVLPALGAALGFAIFQIVNVRIVARVDVHVAIRLLLILATLALGTVTLVTDGPSLWFGAPVRSLLFSAAAGLLHFFVGWTLLGQAQKRIGAAHTGALFGTVPLFGAVTAWALLGERLAGPQVVGLVVVTAGVVIVATSAGRRGIGVPSNAPLLGVAAALGTALCWSLSPVLIREGLIGLPSPSAAATVGLFASAVASTLLNPVLRRGPARSVPRGIARRLVALGGLLVALSLWLQWAAFQRAPVAVVLVALQLTPALVPFLARIGVPAEHRAPLARSYAGVAAIVSGSVLVILQG